MLAPLGGWAEGGPLVTVENDSAVTVPAADAAQDTGLDDTGLDDTGLDDTGLDDTGIDGAGLDDTEELLVEEISIDGMCGVY